MDAQAKMQRQIIRFEPQYQAEVALLIGQVLKDIGVMPDLDGPLDDDDLRQIPGLFSGRGCFWLALEAGTLIGTAALQDTGGDTAKLKCMFVRLDRHGIGVGQALLNEALALARAGGFARLVLSTHVLMTRAHRFYEKNGFTRTGQDGDVCAYELRLLSGNC